MKWPVSVVAVLLTILVAPSAQAQDPPSTIAQYYRCDQAREDIADQIIRDAYADVYAKQAEAGNITSWGWLQHQTGGAWRRILYHSAPTRDAAYEAWSTIVEELDPVATSRLLEICNSHDDYIWTQTATSEAAADDGGGRSTVGTYLVCNIASEARADELVTEVFAPVWEEQVRAGAIGGWSWNQHDVGGRFRRLLVMTGADDISVMNGRDAAFAALQAGHAEALEEFSSICGSHVDYIWNIQLPE